MKRIWKWEFAWSNVYAGKATIRMPKGAEILCAQAQYNLPAIWALVDDSADLEPRTFIFRMTGERVGDEVGKYIGTCQLINGRYVVHLFEAK